MRSEPRYIESHLNVAALMLKLGRTNDAIARYRIVLDLDSRNVSARQALISLSDLMQADGRDGEVAATRAIVARRNPSDAEAQVKLAFTYPIVLASAESGRPARGYSTRSSNSPRKASTLTIPSGSSAGPIFILPTRGSMTWSCRKRSRGSISRPAPPSIGRRRTAGPRGRAAMSGLSSASSASISTITRSANCIAA
jgi:hypothetical protein